MYSVPSRPFCFVFDIGGVVAPDLAELLFADLSQIFNKVEQLAQQVRRKLWHKYAHMSATSKGHCDRMELEHWLEAALELGISPTDGFVERMIELTIRSVRPNPGMLQLLAELRSRGLRLAVLSNTTPFWKGRLVDQLELAKYFDEEHMIFSCDAGASKSSPDFEAFQSLHRALGRPPKHTLVMLDDRCHNLVRALEFGCGATILIPTDATFVAPYVETLIRAINP